MSGATIRVMTVGDYDAVFALWTRCEGVGTNESDTRENIAEYLVRNADMSFVAIVDGTIVGAVLCGHDGRRGYLHHLAVDDAHRRRGIARAMLERCNEALRAAGILKCNLFVYADNDAGQTFWRLEGWSARDDLLVMQKLVR